jgi:hypothetical protein
MLKSVIICAAIASFAIIPQARAQYATPFPGYGPLYGNGTIQSGRDYSDWQQTRRDHGLDYDQDALGHRDTYQPYPSVSPSYGSAYRSRSPYGSPYGHSYGDDD